MSSVELEDEQRALGKRGWIPWMAKNSVASNLLMLLLVMGGLTMLPRIKQEVFPEFDLDFVTISVPYPGASPAEVEQGVLLAVEEAVRSEDVKKVTAKANEGGGLVVVELMRGANRDRALADIKNNVDRITSFPEDAEAPEVRLVALRSEVISLVLSGDQEEAVLRRYGEKLREHLLEHPKLTTVTLAGVRAPEISVEVPAANLRRYGLTLEAIAKRIRAASVDMPGGVIKTSGGEVLIRTTERRKDGRGFAEVVVQARPDGSEVRVRDLAQVEDGFVESDKRAYFFKRPAVMVKAFRVGEQTPVAVANAVREQVKSFPLPEGIEVAVWADWSQLFEQRLDLLLRNASMGLLLVLGVLGMFLEVKLAFWVTLGIPISFIGSLLLLPGADVSINMISLFAYIVVLGIVVDDAIVVGEAIYYRRQQGMGHLAAAIQGAFDVAVPVVFSVVTTMVAFVPMLFVPGVMGKFLFVMPVIVISVLALSLVESLFILPAHLAHAEPGTRHGVFGTINRLQDRFSRGLERVVEQIFVPFLRVATEYRYFTIGCAIAVLMAVVGLVQGGRVQASFFPKVDGELVFAEVRLPFGSPVEDTQVAHDRVVEALYEELEARGGVRKFARGLFHQVGVADNAGIQDPMRRGAGDGSHLTEVAIYLVPEEDRPFSARELSEAWRRRVGEVPGAESVSFRYDTGAPSGKPVDVQLSHTSLQVLEEAASELARQLAPYGGVYEVNDGFEPGKPQLDLELTDQGRAAGLTETMLARQLRGAFYGVEAARQQRGRDEVRTFVRLPERERRSEATLERMLLRTPGGAEMPLGVAARIKRGRAYTQIEREDGRRVVNVTAEVDEAATSGGVVTQGLVADVLPGLMQRYPDLTFSVAGEQREQADTLESLRVGGILAALAIYALLAIVFRSYTQPVVVMSVIPFGLVGAVVGHMLLGYFISMMSLMGLVALTGIVVNDSLVLIVAVNEFRAQGLSPREAVLAGAHRRFRPILLTSATTCLGLAPMLFESSMQARFLIPMAISLAGGVLFSTLICLVIVPANYLVLEDIHDRFDRLAGWLRGDPPGSKTVSVATQPPQGPSSPSA